MKENNGLRKIKVGCLEKDAKSSSLGKEMKFMFQKCFVQEDESQRRVSDDMSGSSFHQGPIMVPSVITCDSPSPSSATTAKSWSDSEDDNSHSNELFECLDLLDIDIVSNTSRYAMEQLVKLANAELVNSKKNGSVAQALICENGSSRTASKRLRRIFLACFHKVSVRDLLNDDGFFSQCSDESDMSSLSSTSDAFGRSAVVPDFGELRLPALQILISSLNLISVTAESRPNDVDLTGTFWVSILGSLAEIIERICSSSRVESTLAIKIIRLLHGMQPKIMDPYIRYSVLPYLLHALEFGAEEKDHILVRETEKLLKMLGVAIPN